jgi:hypothetical protein
VTAVFEAVEEEHQRKRPEQDQFKEPTPTRIQRRRGSVCQYKRDYLGKWKDYTSVVVGVTFYICILPSFSNSTSKEKRQFLIHRTLYVTLSSLVVHHPYLAVTTHSVSPCNLRRLSIGPSKWLHASNTQYSLVPIVQIVRFCVSFTSAVW